MKNNKVIIFVCTAINIILLIACAIFYFQTDREKPEFKLMPSEIIYRSDMDKTKLLENISALDSQDGDVTKRIVIEKIVENSKDSSAIVFYAVSDNASNVAKISRVFKADLIENKTEIVTQTTEKAVTEESSEEVETGEIPQETEEFSQEEPTEETEEVEQTEQTEEERSLSAETEMLPPSQENTGKPIITLKETEITTTAGIPPAWVKVIETLQDDKDSYEKLFYNLNVSKYDLSKVGNYKVSLTTKDSEGNISEPVTLTIRVK